MSKIRLMIVDDSILFRSWMVQNLGSDPRFEVVGYAINAIDAKNKLPQLKPDIMTLDIEMPGFKKEDIKAELKDGYLTIQAQTSSDRDEKDDKGRYIRRERYSGSCQRRFFVGKEVTQEDIKAKFDNGILRLTVPKTEALPKTEENRYIAIEG